MAADDLTRRVDAVFKDALTIELVDGARARIPVPLEQAPPAADCERCGRTVDPAVEGMALTPEGVLCLDCLRTLGDGS